MVRWWWEGWPREEEGAVLGAAAAAVEGRCYDGRRYISGNGSITGRINETRFWRSLPPRRQRVLWVLCAALDLTKVLVSNRETRTAQKG